jgi:hypothetical protein
MKVNWVGAYNRVFEIIDRREPDGCYFSGPRFINKVRELDPYFPNYKKYLNDRQDTGNSTSRRDFFYDILIGLSEGDRIRLLNSILDEVAYCDQQVASEIRAMLAGGDPGPTATVPAQAWNSDRLKRYLSQIDTSIAERDFNRAVTLCYTCLEGFYKAFIRKHVPEKANINEITKLSRTVQRHLRSKLDSYPDEALTMINHVSHTVDRARNGFSESHFDEEAARWLASYIRDLTNSQIRLLIHFL